MSVHGLSLFISSAHVSTFEGYLREWYYGSIIFTVLMYSNNIIIKPNSLGNKPRTENFDRQDVFIKCAFNDTKSAKRSFTLWYRFGCQDIIHEGLLA